MPRNETTVAITEPLANRWSPRSLAASFEISDEQLSSLFEAARWSPSAYNKQPWVFVAGRRGSQTFQQILDGLVEFNQLWASRAAALVLAYAQVSSDGEANPFAHYDLGQSVAHLTVQAQSLGIDVHQMAGFDAAKYGFAVPEGYELVTAIAIGKHEDSPEVPEVIRQRDAAARERKPLEEIVLVRD